MRLVWPVLEPPLGVLELIDLATEDYEHIVHRCGFQLAGMPREWEVRPGLEHAGFEEHRFVLTCVVPVVEQHREAA